MPHKHKFFYFIPAVTVALLLLFPLKTVKAESQQETRCYSECAAYKFGWVGDTCFDMVQNNCSIGISNIATKTAFFIKDAYTLISKGELAMIIGVGDVFKAWFICKPLIEDCIVPQLNACKTVCDYNPYYYSPNISVGSPYSNYLRGVYYDDDKKELRFKTVNNGLGYAWDIKAQATWGSTPNRDGVVSGGGQLFDETIPELLFLGSRQGLPPTLGSTVVDFLIDESNFSNFLSRFKSDADSHYIPPAWEKVVYFEAPEGELTKVFFNVDYGQLIPESNENDNTFILEIDKRPTPAKFSFDNVEFELLPGSLNDFSINVTVKNLGEESGQATLQWYEGEYKPGTNPNLTLFKEVPGSGQTTFNYQLEVDNSNGSPSCYRSKKYSLVVLDPYGGKRTTYFELPLYAGEISGSVENLFGKNVENALVTLSNGMSTSTNRFGNYSLKGITEPGNYTITVTHPDFTQSQTGQIELVYNPGDTFQSYCQIPGLDHKNTDFVIKDEPVLLNIMVRNKDGDGLISKVTISCEKFDYEYDVAGQASFPDIQPEKCQFDVSSQGYISQSQTIILTAPSQDVEFILTKLLGRNSDADLTVHKPRLLWEKVLPDEEFLSDVTATKNGSLIAFYASNSHSKYGKLYFVNPQNGSEINVASVPYTTVAQGNVSIDSSYDGRTVGMVVRASPSTKDDLIVNLFNASGQKYNSTTINGRYSPFMEVSPDGTYVYGSQLMNNSLYKYTKGEIMGTEDKRDRMLIPGSGSFYFTKDNNVISKYKSGLELMNFKLETIRQIGDIEGTVRNIDASNTENVVVVRTSDKLYYFSPSGSWSKESQIAARHNSVAISVGGEYAMVTQGGGGGPLLTLKIYNSAGEDVTPEFEYSDVIFVTANDTGMFYLSARGEKLAYYKIGSYASEYNPNEDTGYEQGEYLVSDLQVYNYESKNFEDTYAIDWYGVSESSMYRTLRRTTFTTGFGTITFSKDTVFTRFEGKPIVLFGQAQIHATGPIEMVLIKTKIYDPDLFYENLYKYYNNQLASNEYVTAKNLHTKYNAENKNGEIKITVIEGEVEIKAQDKTVFVERGHDLTIDKENNINVKKSGIPVYIYLIGMSIVGFLAFIEVKYRNSAVVKKLNAFILKVFHLIIILLKTMLAKTLSLISFLLNKIRQKWVKKVQ